jgi:hypothetical protein
MRKLLILIGLWKSLKKDPRWHGACVNNIARVAQRSPAPELPPGSPPGGSSVSLLRKTDWNHPRIQSNPGVAEKAYLFFNPEKSRLHACLGWSRLLAFSSAPAVPL